MQTATSGTATSTIIEIVRAPFGTYRRILRRGYQSIIDTLRSADLTTQGATPTKIANSPASIELKS